MSNMMRSFLGTVFLVILLTVLLALIGVYPWIALVLWCGAAFTLLWWVVHEFLY